MPAPVLPEEEPMLRHSQSNGLQLPNSHQEWGSMRSTASAAGNVAALKAERAPQTSRRLKPLVLTLRSAPLPSWHVLVSVPSL
jgi:hypothetical protein